MEKTYQDWQKEAKVLGIKGNLPEADLIVAIAAATSPEAVVALKEAIGKADGIIDGHNVIVANLNEEQAEIVKDLNETITNLQKAAVENTETFEGHATGFVKPNEVTDEKIANLQQLISGALAEKDVRTNMYKTGHANGLMRAESIFTGNEPDLIDPLDIKRPEEALPLSGRQQAINELRMYVTTRPGGGLRSGLKPGDKEKADKLLVALGMKPGDYQIPKE